MRSTCSSIHDITSIHNAEHHLTNFVANFPGFAYTFRLSPDGHGSFPFASPGIEKLYGLKPSDVRDDMTLLHALAHPEDAPRIIASLEESARTMTPAHVEFRICRPGLPVRWTEFHSVPVHQGDGSTLWHGMMQDISERKQAEAALVSQANFQQTLLNAMYEVGMQLMIVESGRIIHIGNRKKAFEFGFTEEELDAHPPLMDIVHPDDRARVMDYHQRRLAGEAVPTTYELGLITRDGERREYETSVAVVPGTNPVRVVIIGRDIGERKQMQVTLAAREQEFHSLAENLPDNIARWDTEGHYLYSNPTLQRTLGKTLEEMLGKTNTEIFGDNRFAFIAEAMTQVISTGQEAQVLRVPAPDSMEYHDVRLAPEFDGEGYVISVLGIGRNMTDTYRMQETITRHEQEFRSLAESSPNSIIRYDREGRIRYLNSGLARVLGVSDTKEVIGKLPSEAWPDGRYDAIQQAATQALETETEVCIEICAQSANEPDFYQIRVVPERDVAGQLIGTIAFGVDITGIRSAERQLTNVVANLPGFAFTFRLSPNGHTSFPFASPGIEKLYGLKPEDVKDDMGPLHALAHPEDQPRIEAAIAEAARTRLLFHMESRVCRPGFPERWVETRSMPTMEEADGSIIWHGIMLDITERKATRQRMELLEHAIDLTADAIYLINQDLHFDYVNDTACSMLGYSCEELLTMGPVDIDPGADIEMVRHIMHTTPLNTRVSFETYHRTRDGRIFPVELNGTHFERDGNKFAICVVREISERKKLESQMLHQASYDSLTGLPNRRLFSDRLHEEVARAERGGGNVAILFIDLDYFKEVNDTLGHHYGDQLLIKVPQRIQQCVRESDTVARLGGDEFVVILPEVTEIAHLGRVAQNIIEMMTSPFYLEDHVAYTSASIGIASYPADAGSITALMSAADQAMYAAKSKGRNCFSFFTPAMQQQAQQRLSLGNELRDAISKEQLHIFLQPIVDISSGHVVKAEALIRWKHPQHGMVPPDKFIPIAEEMGLIHDIGDWVFHQAVQAMQRWLEIGTTDNGGCQISVNVSGRQFAHGDLGAAWISHLNALGMPSRHIVIEITESLLLGDETDVRNKLQRFRDAGMNIALDDFGTGYSSMSYLKKFNIDFLKIDRSFVRDLETDPNDRAIAEAIVVMAHKLGLKTIAEGVETEQQKVMLAEVGCDFVQGYFYAKPMPVEEFMAFVKETAF